MQKYKLWPVCEKIMEFENLDILVQTVIWLLEVEKYYAENPFGTLERHLPEFFNTFTFYTLHLH